MSLFDNKVLEDLPTNFSTRHFFDPLHACIFEACISLIDNGRLADPLTLKNYLKEDELQRDMDIEKYLFDLREGTLSLSKSKFYADEIRNCYVRRSLIRIGDELIDQSINPKIETTPDQEISKTEEKLYNYLTNILDKLDDRIPVCYQDYPFFTKSEISVATFNKIIEEYDQVVMFKHEEWPGLNKLSKLRKHSDNGDTRRVSVLTGNGGLFLPQEMQRGADGAMTGFAYPEMLVEVIKLHKQGRIDEAEDLFDIYLPYVRYEQQPGLGLAIRKETLLRRGAISSSKSRDPGPNLSAEDKKELIRLIDRLELSLKGN